MLKYTIMLNSTEKILDSPLNGHIFREVDLIHLFEGTPAKRYGLINKALKKKELIQLRRGLYILSPKYQLETFSSYYLANHIVPHSFVTAESALQFHQWIPERVAQTTSIIAFGRNKKFGTPVGQFIYQTSPLKSYDFFTGVTHIEINHRPVLMATPLRALSDYIYWHKIDDADWSFLTIGLRIDEEYLRPLKKSSIKELMDVYHSKRVNTFLNNLLTEIKNPS